MLDVRLAGDHQYGKLLFTWVSLLVSLTVSFYAVFFALDVLNELWDWNEPVAEGFPTYFYYFPSKHTTFKKQWINPDPRSWRWLNLNLKVGSCPNNDKSVHFFSFLFSI